MCATPTRTSRACCSLDFAHLVFTKLQESRGAPEAGAVAPYLALELREKLKQQALRVSNVVVGALSIVSVNADGDKQRIAVRFKANVIETAGGNATRKLIEQRLVFVRPRGVTTAAPEKTLSLGCPQCGSPEEPRPDGKCPSCGTVTARGQMQWQVKQVETLRYQSVLEPLVTSAGVEEGTGAPTVVAPDLQPALRELKMRDEAFSLEAFTARARHMFMEIQAGWSEVNEARLRPFETDTLFDAHRYWLTRFKEEGKRNVLEDVKIERMQLAKVEHDAFFDAVTLRIYASMKDWYKDKTGKVIGGDPNKARRFSEYWTLVRRVEAAGRKSNDPAKCPTCGASLDKINRAGVCEYCGGKVISGAFDWVLAIITQDEEYSG
jgi:rubrerythrin